MTATAPERAALTGRQRAAAVLVQMGPDRAVRVLRHMSQVEVMDLMAGISELPTLDERTVRGVLSDFVDRVSESRRLPQGGAAAARELLTNLLGTREADTMLASLADTNGNPLAFLNDIDAAQVANFLTDEYPQMIAVILAHLQPKHAAAVMAQLPAEMRPDVAMRIAGLGHIRPATLNTAAELVMNKLSAVVGSPTGGAGNGLETLVSILTHSDRTTERGVVKELETLCEELAEKVKARLFTFEDIVNLDDRSLQRVLRNVPVTDLAVALKNAGPQLRAKFSKNMSERAAADLAEEIETLPPTRLSQVEAAQADVMRVLRELEASGEIVLSRGGDDDPIL